MTGAAAGRTGDPGSPGGAGAQGGTRGAHPTRWDPERYEAFRAERERPFLDLLDALPPASPATVVDAGCGTARTTHTLAERFPDADVVGVDASPEMLAAARPGRFRLECADLRRWRPVAPADMVVSNAVLHWIPDPEAIVAHLASWVAPGGVLAVQVPANHDAPSHRAVREVARRWEGRLGVVPRGDYVLPVRGYEEALGPAFRVRAWDHVYELRLPGDDAVLRWLQGTTLRPHLARLPAEDRQAFLDDLAPLLARAYPAGEDGTVFPFRRRFVVAVRK